MWPTHSVVHKVHKAPRLSIRIVIWILSSDTICHYAVYGHLGGTALPDVEGNGEKKTVGVVPLVVEGNRPLVPFLVYPVVLKDSKMPGD